MAPFANCYTCLSVFFTQSSLPTLMRFRLIFGMSPTHKHHHSALLALKQHLTGCIGDLGLCMCVGN